MSLRLIFWALAALNIVFIALAALGYNAMTVVVVLLLVDIMFLEANRHSEGKRIVDDVKNSLLVLSSKIETTMSRLGESPVAAIEGRLRQHESNTSSQLDALRSFIKADIKDALDRMAAKMIVIENQLNRTKKTLGATVAMFDERVGELESTDDEEPVELELTDEL